jgi:Asp-tRNA(Asn)/Glu-tRNA(Gln) amidotransferase A subunit family amidase
MKKTTRLHPLDTIRVAIEDLHPVKGEITTFAAQIRARHKPDCTAVSAGNDREQDD